MDEELSRWAPGVSLEWALLSLGVGVVLLVFIVVRLWLEFKPFKGGDEEEQDEPVESDGPIMR